MRKTGMSTDHQLGVAQYDHLFWIAHLPQLIVQIAMKNEISVDTRKIAGQNCNYASFSFVRFRLILSLHHPYENEAT